MSDNTSDDWIEVLYIESPAITLLEFRKTIAHKVNEARIKQTKRIYGMLEPMNDFTDAVPTEKLDDELERLAELKTDTTED
jgi:hypothetical protein